MADNQPSVNVVAGDQSSQTTSQSTKVKSEKELKKEAAKQAKLEKLKAKQEKLKNKTATDQETSRKEKKKKEAEKEVNSLNKSTISKCHFIPISFNNVVSQAMCDSGADVSVLPAHLVEKSRIKKYSATTLPSGVGGQPLNVKGESTIDFSINNHVFRHKFIVLDESKIILGSDLFIKNNLRLSFDFGKSIEIFSTIKNELIIRFETTKNMSSKNFVYLCY